MSDPGPSTTWEDGLAFARVYSQTNIRLYHRKGSQRSRLMPGGRGTGVRTASTSTGAGWEYPGRFDGPASDLRMDDVQTARARLIERSRGGGLTTISLTARADIGRYDLWQARGEGVTYVLHDDAGWRSCFSTATGGSPETCTLQATTPMYG